MFLFFLRRLIFILLALVLVNFLGFAFAHVTFQLQQSTTVFGSGREGITPVWPEYAAYARGALHGDFGQMPSGVSDNIAGAVIHASAASMGLLLIAFSLSMVLGLALGFVAVRVDPPRTMPWLAALSTIGLALPSFAVGIFLTAALLLMASGKEATSLLPVAGFGWDAHLVLPVLALSVRPTMQIARVTSALLSEELGKQYVIAARSVGHTWRAIRWDKALRNILVPLLYTFAGSFRLFMTELVLVEWLFDWPGLGRMLVRTLVPPSLSSLAGLVDTSRYLLYPPLVAALLVVFALLFLVADTLATGLARVVDPRLRIAEEEPMHD